MLLLLKRENRKIATFWIVIIKIPESGNFKTMRYDGNENNKHQKFESQRNSWKVNWPQEPQWCCCTMYYILHYIRTLFVEVENFRSNNYANQIDEEMIFKWFDFEKYLYFSIFQVPIFRFYNVCSVPKLNIPRIYIKFNV